MDIRRSLESVLVKLWYTRQPAAYLLLPISWIFGGISYLRRYYYQHLKKLPQFSAPIIIIGNITVGGSGKTPLVIWFANYLKQQGCKPGIVSRGYGGTAGKYPLLVTATSDPHTVGDEALLIARRTDCPMVIAVDRVAAVTALLKNKDCNVVLSDDGLQHYALARTLEVVVLDGDRQCGNNLLLPAGPLRESIRRLQQVDLVVVNGAAKIANYFNMQLIPQPLQNLQDASQQMALRALAGQTVHAVAGIGNPQRFFATLRQLGLEIIEHIFPDHYFFQATDFNFADANMPIIMTEKDAMKCQTFAQTNFWYLPVTAELSPEFIASFSNVLKEKNFHEFT